MFVIWGSVGREFKISSGTFDCPMCHRREIYDRIRLARYFTLYFIPLCETQNLGEFIKCLRCRNNFEPAVLLAPVQNEANDLHNDELFEQIQEELEMGTSVQETKKLLLDMGIDGEVAIKLVNTVVGSREKRCAKCNLSFANTVASCRHCGQAL